MRRPDEQKAINSVFEVLQNEGLNPIEDPSIQDNPDCVFELRGKRVAADCTNFNLEALLKWSNSTKRIEKEKQYEIKFALEPHYWIKESIEAKVDKISTYKANGDAEEVWLIAHALEIPELFDCNDSIINIMQDAIRFLQPTFEEVWFIHHQYPVKRLWRKGDPAVPNFPSWDTPKDKYPFEQII